jgi:hypothetical protein
VDIVLAALVKEAADRPVGLAQGLQVRHLSMSSS